MVSLLVAVTAAQLFVQCSANVATDLVKRSLCVGYVTGFHEATEQLLLLVRQKPLYCLPDNYTNGMLESAVASFGHTNPELVKGDASGMVLNALMTAFPCPK